MTTTKPLSFTAEKIRDCREKVLNLLFKYMHEGSEIDMRLYELQLPCRLALQIVPECEIFKTALSGSFFDTRNPDVWRKMNEAMLIFRDKIMTI